MTNKDIQTLIDRYLEGETSPQEERQLARELQRTDLPEEWEAIRLMLGELAMGEAEYDAVMEERSNTATAIREQLSNEAAIGQHVQKPSALLRAIRVISTLAALYLVGLFFYQQMPESNREQAQNEVPHYYTQDQLRGSTLKDVYTSRLRASQERTITYHQLKNLNYEKD